jgi:hypothetical protein
MTQSEVLQVVRFVVRLCQWGNFLRDTVVTAFTIIFLGRQLYRMASGKPK